jgi:hypothetical protein
MTKGLGTDQKPAPAPVRMSHRFSGRIADLADAAGPDWCLDLDPDVFLSGIVGVLAAGPSQAETYGSSVVLSNGFWRQQTFIHCTEPTRMNRRIPERCTLKERAIAYANRRTPAGSTPKSSVRLAIIVLHPRRTLAYRKLDGDQSFATLHPPGLGSAPAFVGSCARRSHSGGRWPAISLFRPLTFIGNSFPVVLE